MVVVKVVIVLVEMLAVVVVVLVKEHIIVAALLRHRSLIVEQHQRTHAHAHIRLFSFRCISFSLAAFLSVEPKNPAQNHKRTLCVTSQTRMHFMKLFS